MGKFSKDFKEFIAKGNVMDMAVGVVVGGAFNKIVTSLVNDIIMPLIGLLMGGLSVTDMKVVFNEAEMLADPTVAEHALMYGNFIQAIIDFFIIALSVFIALRVFTKLQRKRKDEKDEEAKKEEEAK